MGAYSTKDVRNTDDLEDFFPPTGNYIGEKSNRWSATYFFEQTLFEHEENNKQTFGVFGTLGITDGKGSVSDHFFTLGVGGNSPFKNRMHDQWGIGYFHYSLSDGLNELNIPSIPGVYPGFGMSSAEAGFEGFYEYYFTPWFTLGADIQFISPGIEKYNGLSNTGVTFLGFRSMIKF
ncbi:carbohydrate porin [Namhaeicola litoreus]|uniref:Carbohydrate porin n=1 Tax=Namhaeicola litoreus TaxID=1052145 RepID=A0ABW3Y3L3_9FLAO